MAGRGAPKLKEYRTHITSVRHWLKEIEFDGLIVCEVYCGAFGNCQVILPTINAIMLAIDDAEEKVKWLVINVAKIEEDQRQLLAEEEKKKAELESVLRRRSILAANDPSNPNNNTSTSSTTSSITNTNSSTSSRVGGINDRDDPANNNNNNMLLSLREDESMLTLVEEEEITRKTAWDKVTIPKLEKLSGYENPRPLWLFLRDGQILYELNSANPPKMTKLLHSILSGIPLSPSELASMDFAPDTNASERKKKRNKKAAALAADKKKEKLLKNKEKIQQRAEVQRSPEYIVQIAIRHCLLPSTTSSSSYTSTTTNTRGFIVALYTKDGTSDDFLYAGQSERIKPIYQRPNINNNNNNTNNSSGLDDIVTFYKFFSFPKQEMENDNNDIELKFVVYDAESDDIKKDHPINIGDCYIPFKNLVSQEDSPVELKIIKHVETKLSARNNQAASQMGDDTDNASTARGEGVGTLVLTCKTRKPEGVVTNWNFSIACRNAPSCGIDNNSITTNNNNAANTDQEDTPMSPAPPTTTTTTGSDYICVLSVQDSNSACFGSHECTDSQYSVMNGSPVFANKVVCAHHSRDDRLLRFSLYDNNARDPNQEKAGLLASAIVRFDQFLSARRASKEKDRVVRLPMTDVEGHVITDGFFIIKADSPDEEEDMEDDANRSSTTRPSTRAPEQRPEMIESSFILRNPIDIDTHTPLILALYQRRIHDESITAFKLISSSECIRVNADHSDIIYNKTFLVPTPKEQKDIDMTNDNTSDQMNDDDTPTNNNNNNNNNSNNNNNNSDFTYRVVIYRSESVSNFESNENIIGESLFSLTHSLISSRASHEFPLVNARGESTSSSIKVNMKEVGYVTPVELAFTASELPSIKQSSSSSQQPNSWLLLYAKNLHTQSYTLVGATERLMNTSDPVWAQRLTVHKYSNFNRSLLVRVYDADMDSTPWSLVNERDLIGETSVLLDDFLSSSSQVSDEFSQAPPMEFRLLKSDGGDPVNGGRSIIRIQDVSPRVPMNMDTPPILNEDDNRSTTNNQSDIDMSKDEKEYGTSPSMNDGSRLVVSVSCKDIPKYDWLSSKYPLVACYKKNGETGRYDFISVSERIKDDKDPKFNKLFVLDCPQDKQLYKFVVVDATDSMTDDEYSVYGNLSQSTSSQQQHQNDHLGECIIDISKLLVKPIQVHLCTPSQEALSNGACMLLTAADVGKITPYALYIDATNLPVSELFGACNPICILYGRNAATGVSNMELSRTERLKDNRMPVFNTICWVDAYAREDREIRVAIYDADEEGGVTERDVLGESVFLLNSSFSSSDSIELKLTSKSGRVTDPPPTVRITLDRVAPVGQAARRGFKASTPSPSESPSSSSSTTTATQPAPTTPSSSTDADARVKSSSPTPAPAPATTTATIAGGGNENGSSSSSQSSSPTPKAASPTPPPATGTVIEKSAPPDSSETAKARSPSPSEPTVSSSSSSSSSSPASSETKKKSPSPEPTPPAKASSPTPPATETPAKPASPTPEATPAEAAAASATSPQTSEEEQEKVSTPVEAGAADPAAEEATTNTAETASAS